MAHFEVVLLPRAQRGFDSLSAAGQDAVSAALDQLALDPEPDAYWSSEEDEQGKHVFAGAENYWKVTYEVDYDDRIVYVHAIGVRPSWSFDPRMR